MVIANKMYLLTRILVKNIFTFWLRKGVHYLQRILQFFNFQFSFFHNIFMIDAIALIFITKRSLNKH